MIRFILKRKWRDAASGCEGSSLSTLDAEVPELEAVLTNGGYGESGYDRTEMVGIEVFHAVEPAQEDEMKRAAPPRPASPVTINLDAGYTARRKTQQELLVAMWNTGYPVGTSCLYEEVVGDAGKRSCTTLSEAWLLGGHTAVVRVEFTLPTKHRIDTVSLEHITLPNAEPPPGP